MRLFKVLALAGVVALAVLGVSVARSGHARQYYEAWQRSAQGYYFSVYHYRPDAGDPAYRTNYAIYYPATPQYIYYFNPLKGAYWGRFDVKTKAYSLLAEKDRAGRLKDIPEKAFPAEGPLPQVPDAKDKLTLAEPPDLPAGEKLGNTARVGDKADDLTAADDKTPPAEPKQDKPAPAAPVSAGTATQPTPIDQSAAPAATGDGVSPTSDSVVPGSTCQRPFGGCHGHGSGW